MVGEKVHAKKADPDVEVDHDEVLEELWDMRKGARRGCAGPVAFRVRSQLARRVMGGGAQRRRIRLPLGRRPQSGGDTLFQVVGAPASGSFSIAKFGMDLANALAQEWAHVHEGLYGLWQERGCPEDKRSVTDDLARFPPSEAGELVRANGYAGAMSRLSSIRRLGLAGGRAAA